MSLFSAKEVEEIYDEVNDVTILLRNIKGFALYGYYNDDIRRFPTKEMQVKELSEQLVKASILLANLSQEVLDYDKAKAT